MSEPITKGLREYIERHPTMMHAVGLTDLLDNIDAVQRSLEQENERLRDESEHTDDWIKLPVDGEAPSQRLADWLERRGLVTGPLDANGELWHSGDMSDSEWGVIEGICFDNGVWFISGHDISAPWIRADSIAHYHPDTWESIIADAMRAGRADVTVDVMPLIKRCKALAGEDE